MPQLIEVPGMGQVEFPDGMSDDQISSAIRQNIAPQGPMQAFASRQRQDFSDYRNQVAIDAEAPSPVGSFLREGARSIAPGLAGFASGAASGAGMGALGAGPIGAGVGAVIGGIGGAMGTRMVQDEISDAVAPGSFMGTASAAQDFSVNPGSSLLGGAVAQGKPSMQVFGAAKNIATVEGRALLAQSLKAGASPAAKAALSETVDVGLGAGIGAGMSLASGDGMALENAAIGAIFSKPWIGGRASPAIEQPPANTETGVIPFQGQVERGPVTRMGNGEMSESSPWMVMPTRGLPAPEAPAGLLPSPAALPELPAPRPGRKDSPPVVDIPQRDAQLAQLNALDDEFMANRVRREELVAKFKERGQPINKGVGRRMIDILDNRAKELESKIGNLRSGEIITPASPQRLIVEVDNRPFGTKPADRLALPDSQNEPIPQRLPAVQSETPPQVQLPEVPAIEAPPAIPESSGIIPQAPEPPQAQGEAPVIPLIPTPEPIPQTAPEIPPSSPEVPAPRNYARAGNIKSEPGQRDFIDFIQEHPINIPPKHTRTGGEWNGFDEFHQSIPPLYKSKTHFSTERGRGIAEVADAAHRAGLIDAPDSRLLMAKYSEAIRNRKLKRTTGNLNSIESKALAAEKAAPRQTRDFDAALVTNRRSRAGEKVLAGDLAEGETFQFQGEPFKVSHSSAVEGFDGPEGLVVLQDHDKFGTQVVDAGQPLRIAGKEKSQVWDHEADLAKEAVARRLADEELRPQTEEEYAPDLDDDEEPAWMKTPAPEAPAKESLTLKAHDSDAEIKAEKDAAQTKDEIARRQAAPLKGGTGDMTADMFGEGDTPLFNERRDSHPENKQSFLDGLKAHRANVDQSIRDGRGRSQMTMAGVTPADVKLIYRAALDVAITTLEAGKTVSQAVKAALAHIKGAAPAITAAEAKAIERRMFTDTNAERVFNSGQDARFKTEMPKVQQELAGRGIHTPTKGQIVNELIARFPDQAAYIRKNADKIFDGMIYQKDSFKGKSQSAREWKEWTDAALDKAAAVSEWATKGTPFRDIGDKLNLFNKTFFGTLHNKALAAADGRLTGRESPAFKKLVGDLFGKAPGAGGVHDVSLDLDLHTATKAHQNRLQSIENDTKAFTSKLPKAAREAFWQRVTDHITDPARDGELASQPEMKNAVDAIVKLRTELYDMKIAAGVDMGNAGPRSMPRVPDTARILGHEKEFLAQAAKAYDSTWKREIRKLNVERAAAVAAGDAAAIKRIDTKIGEIDAQDSAVFAEKYLYAMKSDDLGISADGEGDLYTPHNGKPNTEKSRVFGPEADQFLGKFYERNAVDLMMRDINDAHRSATVAKLLSGKNPDGTIDPLGGWKKLRKDMEDEGNRESIPLAAEIIKTYFDLGGNVSGKARQLLELAHSHTQIGRLAGAMISSFGDPTLIGARSGGGLPAYAKAYANTAKDIYRSMRGASPSEWGIAADFMGLTSDGLNSILSASRHMDAFGGKLGGKLISRFHVLTGLTHLTNATHRVALEMGHAHILAQLNMAKAGGKLANWSKKLLNEVGIHTSEIDDVLKFAKRLESTPDKASLLTADTPAAAKYRKALHLFRDSGATLDPTRGSRPQWANHPVGSLYYQLSSFLYAFHHKVTMRGFRQLRDAAKGEVMVDDAMVKLNGTEQYMMVQNTLAGFAAIAATAYGVQTVREALRRDPVRVQKDKKRTAGEIQTSKLMSAASRTGFLGPYDALFNIITGARYNRDPSSAFHGAALGGAFQMTGNLIRLLNEKYEDSINDRTTPRSNVNARKLGRDISDMIVTPAVNALGATLPGGPLGAAVIQGASHPAFREKVVSGFGGPMRIQR